MILYVERMDAKFVDNADPKKWGGETGQRDEGWITSWAGESQEEVHAAIPESIAVSTRGRKQIRSDVNDKIVVDPEEMHKRRYDDAGFYARCCIVANCIENYVHILLVISLRRPERCRLR